MRRPSPCILAATLALSTCALGASAANATARQVRSGSRPVCAKPTPGHAACASLIVLNQFGRPYTSAGPIGLNPADLQDAYKLPSATNGAGQTVAIVDAKDDPNAEADLQVYRNEFGLPTCTTANGCFKKVNQTGGSTPPPPDSGWAEEISIDIDMVSAICPNCHILLVEATTNSLSNLYLAENEAVALGAKEVSNSWMYELGEYSFEAADSKTYFKHPGVAITAASGDQGGDFGAVFPAASKFVTAVGGTSLVKKTSTPRGWTETAWSGAGSGCSYFIAKPPWQHDKGCASRTVADVSAVADPDNGVSVYDTYFTPGWEVFGGTSVGSPIIASVYALAGGTFTFGQVYDDPGALFDVKKGSNGSCGSYLCDARKGYDGPTGLGTPDGIGDF